MHGVTTYSDPLSFCATVCQLLTERSWRIRVMRHHFNGDVSLYLPDGTSGGVGNPKQALILLCRRFVDKFHIPIRYEEPDTFYGNLKVTKPSADAQAVQDLEDAIREQFKNSGPGFYNYTWQGVATGRTTKRRRKE